METKNPFDVLDDTKPTQQESLPALTPIPPEVKQLIDAPSGKLLPKPKSKRALKKEAKAAASGPTTDGVVPAPKTPEPTSEKEALVVEQKKSEKKGRSRSKKKTEVAKPTEATQKASEAPLKKPSLTQPPPVKKNTVPVPFFTPGSVPTQEQKLLFKKIIMDLRSSYVPSVDEGDVEWFKGVFGKTPNISPGNVRGINAHARMAVLRTMANIDQYTNVLLVDIDRTLRYGTVDFVYGTESRDNALVALVNKELERCGFCAPGVSTILAHFVGQPLVPDDMNRRINGSGSRSKIGILMDVYALGVYKMHPVNLASMGYEIWTWCGHVFNGPFGGYEGAIWCREGIDFSNVWFKADETANPYDVHDACDIMHKSGKVSFEDTSVVWGVVNRVNTKFRGKFVPVYSIVVGQRSDKPFIDNSYRSIDPIDTVFLEMRDPIIKSSHFDYINNVISPWLASVGLYKKRKIPIAMSMYADLKDKCTARFYNQWTFGSVLTDVNNYFSDHPWFTDLEKKLPAQFVNYRFDVASAIYSELCEKKKDCLLIMNSVHGMNMNVANDQFKAIGTAPTPFISKQTLGMFAIGLGVAGLAYAAYKGLIQPTTILSVAKKSALITPAIVGFAYTAPRKAESAVEIAATNLTALSQGYFVPIHIPYVSEFVFDQIGGRILSCPSTWKRLVIGAVYTVFIGPMLEECTKHVLPFNVVKWALALLFANLDYAEPTSALNFTVSFMKHYLLALLPIDTAIVLHCLNNLTAFAVELRNAPHVRPMCIGTAPCFKALFADKTCCGRQIVSNSNCSNLTEFRIQSETNPMVVLQTDLLPFSPKTESFVKPSNCLPKYPAALDGTIEVSDNLIDFSQDANFKESAAGYYQLFAVSVVQCRPASTAYNTYMMILNRLMKATPLKTLNDTSFLGIRSSDPDGKYYYCRPMETLFACFKKALSHDSLAIYEVTNHIKSPYKTIPLVRNCISSENLEYYETDEAFLIWLKHLSGVKRSMYYKYRETFKVRELTMSSKCVTRVTTSLKNDETLLKRVLNPGAGNFVPRPVHRVDPEFASYVGVYIYAASIAMKQVFYFYPILTDGWVVTLTFGSSLNSLDLSLWFDQAKSTDATFDRWPQLMLTEIKGFAHIIVAGDDVLIVVNELKHHALQIIEADVSSCDHSIRHAMLNFEWSMLMLFGVPSKIINLLSENSSAKLKIYHPNDHREYVTVRRGQERNTGGVDTTIGNSLCVGGTWLSTLLITLPHGVMSDEELQEFILDDYGFDMKIKRSNFGNDCYLSQTGTFLKGMWYHGIHPCSNVTFWWGPLPSRLIKLSKVMTKPLSICRQNAKDKFKKHNDQATLDELWYCTMQMIQATYTFVVIPPVRKWFDSLIQEYTIYAIKHMLPFYNEIRARTDDSSEIHKVQALCLPAEQLDMCPCWVDRLASHYKVDVSMVLDWSEHLQLVRPGLFSIHPFWQIMADVDYN